MSEVRAEMNRRKDIERWLDDQFPDREFTLWDGLDYAFIGVICHEDKNYYACYDETKILDMLEERDGMEFAEAVEFLDYNIRQCITLPHTPSLLIRYSR